jgi:hypothetical protein
MGYLHYRWLIHLYFSRFSLIGARLKVLAHSNRFNQDDWVAGD